MTDIELLKAFASCIFIIIDCISIVIKKH